jgi:D-alanyl-D-alanine carboxypeptidase
VTALPACRIVLLWLLSPPADAAPPEAPREAEPEFRLEAATSRDLSTLLDQARRDGIDREAIKLKAAYRPAPEKHPLAPAVVKQWGRAELPHWIASVSEHITAKSVDLDLGLPLTIAGAGAFKDLSAYRWLRKNARRFGFNQAFPSEPWHFTHYLPPGAVEGPAVGTVSVGPLGTVLRPELGPNPPVAEQILTGAVVGWNEATRTLVYSQCWREEGGGDGCVVKWEAVEHHRVRRELPVFSPAQADTTPERRDRMLKARAILQPDTKDLVTMPAVAWPAGAAVLESDGLQVHWRQAEGVLEVWKDGRVQGTLQVRRLAPWVPQPLRLYRRAGANRIVVEMVHDPQEAFCTGANLVSVFETLP